MAPTWDELPSDVLARVFSFLPPDSLARAMAACTHWHACARSLAPPATYVYPPWLLAMPSRGPASACCFAHDPRLGRWHRLPLDFLPYPVRLVGPLAAGAGLLLCKLDLASSPALRLALCNPFARHFQLLPDLITPRSTPAVGVVGVNNSTGGGAHRRLIIIVAGGSRSAASSGGASSYEPTWEMFDSREGKWREAGPVPVEFAVRLTVWTPNESVHAGDGVVYWMTSARAYSVVGFDVERREWREVKVPMADRLEWAALVRRPSGRLGLAGGGAGEGIRVWELREGDEWAVVGAAPSELGRRFVCCREREEEEEKKKKKKKKKRCAAGSSSTKCECKCVCVGGEEGSVYVLRELGSEMVVWRESGSDKDHSRRWEWSWVEACSDPHLPRIPITPALLHPTLSSPMHGP